MMKCAFISSTKQTMQKLNTGSGLYILMEVALVTDAVGHRNLYGTSIICRVIVASAVQKWTEGQPMAKVICPITECEHCKDGICKKPNIYERKITMEKLKTLEKVVLEALEEVSEARGDDFILLLEVCRRKELNLAGLDFKTAMEYHRQFGIPNWKSVERARRKIQAARPDLISPEAAKKRRKAENTYKEYAHS